MPPSASSLLVGRRFCCASGSGPRGKKGLEDNVFSKKRLVFLGSPQLAAIVTQPPSARLRGRRKLPSPVAEHALDSGFPHHLIFTPEKAGEALLTYIPVCCRYIVELLLFKELYRMVLRKLVFHLHIQSVLWMLDRLLQKRS